MATTISSATTILASSSFQNNLNTENSKQTPNSQSLKKAVRVIHKQIIRIRKKYPLESLQSQGNQNKEPETTQAQQHKEAQSEQNLNSSAVRRESEIQTGKVIPVTPKPSQIRTSVSANTLVPVESHASSLTPSSVSASSLGDETTPLHHPSNLWGRFILPVIILLLLIFLLLLFQWFWTTSIFCDSEFCCDYEQFGPKI